MSAPVRRWSARWVICAARGMNGYGLACMGRGYDVRWLAMRQVGISYRRRSPTTLIHVDRLHHTTLQHYTFRPGCMLLGADVWTILRASWVWHSVWGRAGALLVL